MHKIARINLEETHKIAWIGSKINAFEVKSSGIGKHESINEFATQYSKHVHKT